MRSNKYQPEIVVAIASAAWGLFWIPLRAFEQQGLTASWATLAQFLAPLIMLLPIALLRRLRNLPSGIRQLRAGIFIGLAIALYVQSLLLTDVARALILFYAMPAWGTLLEIGLMGRKLTLWRTISLLLSLLGLVIIIGGNALTTINAGDIMALLSGMLFAIGAMQVRNGPDDVAVFEQLFAFFFYGFCAALLLSQLPLASFGPPPAPSQLVRLVPWLTLTAVAFLIPVMWGIYWGSRHVDPGRLGILLQIEAVVGIASAALFAGEPFGTRQAVGAVFVVTAGIAEVIGNRSNEQDSSQIERMTHDVSTKTRID